MDETAYIIQGYLILTKGIFFSDDTMPFAKVISGLPLFLLKPNIPSGYYDLYLDNEFMKLGADFLYKSNSNSGIMVFFARIFPLLLSLLLGFFVYRWASDLYGTKAGILSLILYTFSPNILAESASATSDLAAVCFMFGSTYFLWRYLKFEKKTDLLVTSLLFGLAQVTKLTALLLIPVFVLFLAYPAFKARSFDKAKKAAIAFAVILVASYIMINMAFLFQGTFTPLGKSLADDPVHYFDKAKFNSESISQGFPAWARNAGSYYLNNVPTFIPYPYLKNFMGAVRKYENPIFLGGYLNGKLHENGDNYFYYLENFLLRTPIALILLIILSIALSKKYTDSIGDNIMLLIIPIALFLYFSSGTMWGGIRYLLPIYPFMFVFVSKLANSREKKIIFPVIALAAWFVMGSILAFPSHPAYFNEAAIGEGHFFLSGPSFDVGQDLKALGNYAKANSLKGLKLAYFGEGSPDYYGLNYSYIAYYGNLKQSVENCSRQEGLVAISITYLHPTKQLNNPDCFDWLSGYKPVKKIGNTIFLYEV
ncbi:MAG TPA: glycosyltransferase family 39 protein [Candidatus Nanoarchaeia archaeon]|nr:glycosyltransferase family 39 protein [Candidatus Nanoarchaeia archaeon]